MTHVTVTVRNPADPERSWEGLFLVDTGSWDCLVPERALREIGIEPKGEREYELADGSKVRLKVGGADVEFMGDYTFSTVIFGKDEAEPILGVTALESVGIEIDPRTGRLKRLPAVRLKKAARRGRFRRRPGPRQRAPCGRPSRLVAMGQACVTSALNYARAISERLGVEFAPGPKGFPDDFAGMFPPAVFASFVVPCWEKLYRGLAATERRLHSELLRAEHLPYLRELRVGVFDPSADQYLTPRILRQMCPCRFTARILSWQVREMSARELQELYREYASCDPVSISFSMSGLSEEPKMRALLEVARAESSYPPTAPAIAR